MINIYGAVGYTYLESSCVTNPKKILILSDIHSKLKYCNNFINISEWFSKNMNKINILLEEVSREDFNLGELWSESDHTIELKNLFLNNQKNISDIDIRPYLIPFSWEIEIKENDDIFLYKYLENLNEFLYFKKYKIYKKIDNVYKSKYLKNSPLGIHFNVIKNKFKEFLNNNAPLLNYKINFIKKTN
jgi:hypothetical protein